MPKQQVFVAYSSRDAALSGGIIDAVRRANALPLPVMFEPWVFNDIAGAPVISPILAKIDEFPFVVADITYLNLNVVYEIGFAIGRGKRAFLVRNRTIEGDKTLVNAVGIFDTLGYHEYDFYEELKDRLTAHIEPTSIPFSTSLDSKFPVYIVEPSVRDDGINTSISRIKKARYPYRSFHGVATFVCLHQRRRDMLRRRQELFFPSKTRLQPGPSSIISGACSLPDLPKA